MLFQNIQQAISRRYYAGNFLRFFRQNLNIDNSKELAYLYTIARNLCVDTFRKKTVESLDKIEEEATYDPSDKWADDFALKSIIAKLPKDEQELLLLRYANELPINSICKITGLSRFAIHRRLSKALKLLKEELKKEVFMNE